jgi:hypothetical protein
MPKAPQALEVLGDLQRSLAVAAMQAVHGSVNTPWKEFYVDIHPTPDGTAVDIEFRVIPVFGTLISVFTPKPLETIVREIWNMNQACFSPPWKGMKLTVTSEGDCKINFSYDAD